MNCPVCDDVRMREVEKENIMIDVCPSCKGVWLERGELEKLQRGIQEIRQPFDEWQEDYEKKKYASNEHPSHNRHTNPRYKKKKSVMDVFGDLFD